MSLQPCRECGKDVSDDAATCPHCGTASPAREKGDDWRPCPQCGSGNTKRVGPGLLGFICFSIGGCMIWIPVIGWIATPFLLVAAVYFWIMALLPSGKVSFQCGKCKKWFTVPKTELAE